MSKKIISKISKKRREFNKILSEMSLSSFDKTNIQFLVNYFETNNDPNLASRSYLFQGEPGVGKSFLADKIVTLIGKEILYIGFSEPKIKGIKSFKDMKSLLTAIDKSKEQVIYLDDLNYIFNKSGFNEIDSADKRSFMNILNIVKNQGNKLFITTLNELHELDDRMIDRIEVKIKFDIPNAESKKTFLTQKFKKFLTPKKIESLAVSSIGYNYRDLPELIKLAYRFNNKLTIDTLKQAVKVYRPTQLMGFEVLTPDIKLSSVIGNKDAINAIKRLKLSFTNKSLSKALNMSRNNLLLFHGTEGTGKSYMAQALAGELEYPLINIRGGDLMTNNPFARIDRIIRLSKRYKQCIIFIDEAEKILGSSGFDDNMLAGDFQRQIEGASKERVEAIFILAMNNPNRFGSSFRSRFREIEFKTPAYEDRLQFCELKKNVVKKELNLDIDFKLAASQTKGMSFRELENYWNELVFRHLEGEKIDEFLLRKVSEELQNKRFSGEMFG